MKFRLMVPAAIAAMLYALTCNRKTPPAAKPLPGNTVVKDSSAAKLAFK
ncbi:hypothetical protein [Deminuibacter soli]|nr:hypothetical protein [Deminuibacter soli]